MDYRDENMITGRFFTELSKFGNFENGLVFGSGFGVFPYIAKRVFSKMNITAYDTDELKVSQMRETHIKRINIGIDIPVLFTKEMPTTKFDVVFAITVFHENPVELINEATRYLGATGYLAVMDYDMKNMAFDDFFKRWGYTRDEKIEEAKMGRINSYKLHTSSGIEDCISIMERNGIQTLVAKGKQTSSWYCSPLPPSHYIYIGKKR